MQKMNKITKQDRINSVIDRFQHQYQKPMIFFNGYSSSHVIERLKALSNPTEDQVNEVIGNKSWIELICDECSNDCSELIYFDARYDDNCCIGLCKSCLSKALAL